MAKKKKKKKKNNFGVISSIGADYDAYRHKSGKKSPRPMTAAREVVRREIREIISDAKEAKKVITRNVPNAAKNGIKDLKIDGARLVDFLKGIKVKESPSQINGDRQITTIRPKPVKLDKRAKTEHMLEVSFYDTWYNLICSEIKELK